jgi:hypothetical protein
LGVGSKSFILKLGLYCTLGQVLTKFILGLLLTHFFFLWIF